LLNYCRKSACLTGILYSRPAIGAEYTEVFRCPHSQKSRGLRSGDREGQLAGRPRPMQLLPDNAVVPHHAWTAGVVAAEEAHVPRALVNHSPTKRCYTAPLSPVGTTCPKELTT
jgi:hypothetical protein